MNGRISRGAAGLLVAAAMFAGSAAQASELVLNGGFETGDFTSWTTNFAPSFVNSVDVFAPHTGAFAAYFGQVGTPAATISQTLATTAGVTYDIIFWLQNEADSFNFATPNSFVFSWNGAAIETISNSAAFDYKQYEYTLKATGASTVLQFAFTQSPAYWDLDDVSVIPEPSSLALAGLAVGLVAAQRRRRKLG